MSQSAGVKMKKWWCIWIICLCWVSSSGAQESPQGESPTPGISCREQANALGSGAYIDGVSDYWWPAAFPTSRGVTVTVQFTSGIKAFLHADGRATDSDNGKYELWLGTARVPKQNAWAFLSHVASSCKLPPDPADALKLLNIQWQVKELTRDQFERLHRSFMIALNQYVTTVQERSNYFMTKNRVGGGVDAGMYPIVYDNSWEHFEIEESTLRIKGQKTSMIRWVEEFRNFAEQSFHTNLRGEQEPNNN